MPPGWFCTASHRPAWAMTTASVLVVGAGVSGCACGAVLAAGGSRVTLVNSAMDRVGLPCYGPDLVREDGESLDPRDILDRLPKELRAVWRTSAWEPASGEPVLNVDRRGVSVETKRVLEQLPGLQFRQGFVTDLRLVSGGGSEPVRGGGHRRGGEPGAAEGGAPVENGGVGLGATAGARTTATLVEGETVFGEVFQADAVVIAVGLSLGATTRVGADTVPGGRYGEPPSEGLRAALEALGARFREISLEVGPRISVRGAREWGWISPGSYGGADHGGARSNCGTQATADDGSGAPAGERFEERLVPVAGQWCEHCWPEEYPPAPYWRPDLRADRMVLGAGAERLTSPWGLPALSPDGVATSEAYLRPNSRGLGDGANLWREGAKPIATRMPSHVTAQIVAGLDETGRLSCSGQPVPVWVIGRAAGAQDYTTSLASALRAAHDIARWLSGDAAACHLRGDDEREERRS